MKIKIAPLYHHKVLMQSSIDALKLEEKINIITKLKNKKFARKCFRIAKIKAYSQGQMNNTDYIIGYLNNIIFGLN